jgi:F-type H+-transporting ATPase subunit epsilon
VRLRIVTPQRQLVDAEVTELTAPGVAGELGVLAQHTTFLGGLDAGVLSYREGGNLRRLVIDGGYAEVADDVVTVLADGAETPDEVNVTATREELSQVERDLAAGAEDPAVVQGLLRRQKFLAARLSVAS